MDTILGVDLLRLTEPLAPGDSLRLRVVQRLAVRGYPNSAPDRSLGNNGSFLNRELFPSLGYSPGGELGSDELPRKYKPAPARRPRLRNSPEALQPPSFTAPPDFGPFRPKVSARASRFDN